MITFILPLADSTKIAEEDMNFIRRYNGDYSGQRGFYDVLFDTPFLLRQFWRNIKITNGRVLLEHKSILIYCFLIIVYFLSPFDLIPEMVFGIFGYIDDLAFVFLFIVAVASSFLNVL